MPRKRKKNSRSHPAAMSEHGLISKISVGEIAIVHSVFVRRAVSSFPDDIFLSEVHCY